MKMENEDIGCPICGALTGESCRTLRARFVHVERFVKGYVTRVITSAVKYSPEKEVAQGAHYSIDEAKG
jgi:hypothetical protein